MSSDEKALDVEALAKRWSPCGPCDFGVPISCTCDPGDSRVDIAALIAEVQRLTAERDRARQELARKDQALDEIRALAVAWTDGMGEEIKRSSLSDIDFYAILRAAAMNKAGTEVQRILSDLAAALDAHLNKEDDSE